jgi:hypothetical protein
LGEADELLPGENASQLHLVLKLQAHPPRLQLDDLLNQVVSPCLIEWVDPIKSGQLAPTLPNVTSHSRQVEAPPPPQVNELASLLRRQPELLEGRPRRQQYTRLRSERAGQAGGQGEPENTQVRSFHECSSATRSKRRSTRLCAATRGSEAVS